MIWLNKMTGTLKLIDNRAATQNTTKYVTICINMDAVVESWRGSLFSFEWLTPRGEVMASDKMRDVEREKFQSVQFSYKESLPLERPILGIGVMDNIEIGSRRDVLLTLYSLGVKTLDVHVPKSNIEDFKDFVC